MIPKIKKVCSVNGYAWNRAGCVPTKFLPCFASISRSCLIADTMSMHKKRAQFALFCTHPKPCYRHCQIHEEKMRPHGRTSTYMSLDKIEIVAVFRMNDLSALMLTFRRGGFLPVAPQSRGSTFRLSAKRRVLSHILPPIASENFHLDALVILAPVKPTFAAL